MREKSCFEKGNFYCNLLVKESKKKRNKLQKLEDALEETECARETGWMGETGETVDCIVFNRSKSSKFGDLVRWVDASKRLDISANHFGFSTNSYKD